MWVVLANAKREGSREPRMGNPKRSCRQELQELALVRSRGHLKEQEPRAIPWNLAGASGAGGADGQRSGTPGRLGLDDMGFPKRGSIQCMARQYSAIMGKVGNCQVGVSLNHATDDGCSPTDVRLYLPESWAEEWARRQTARVRREVVFERKWQLGLEVIDRVRMGIAGQGRRGGCRVRGGAEFRAG